MRRKLRLDLLTEVPPEALDFTPKSSEADFGEFENKVLYHQPRPSLDGNFVPPKELDQIYEDKAEETIIEREINENVL